MTDKLKCPYCGKGLYEPSEYFAVCTNEKCAYHNFEYPIEVWRDLIGGEQARFALKVAVDALNDIVSEHEGLDGEIYACSGIASRALIKINEITSTTKG